MPLSLQNMLKTPTSNAGESKRKVKLDKKFKSKLGNIHKKKLLNINLENQLNTICKKGHFSCTNSVVEKILNKNKNLKSDSISTLQYENLTRKKITLVRGRNKNKTSKKSSCDFQGGTKGVQNCSPRSILNFGSFTLSDTIILSWYTF